MKKLYAFWRYTGFPGFLGGPVTDIRNDGKVETSNYGPGFLFKPVLIVPHDKGVALHTKLNDLQKRYETATEKLREEFKKMLNDTVPELTSKK